MCPSGPTARRSTLEAQRLLEVRPGFGAWLDERWTEELQGLLEHCRDDLVVLLGAPPREGAAARLLRGLEAGSSRPERFVVGHFDAAGQMCAALEVQRDWPRPGAWFVPMLLVRPDMRGRGLAAALLQRLETWARAEGGRAIHLALQRRHPGAVGFARRTGFGEAALGFVRGGDPPRPAMLAVRPIGDAAPAS